jgi:hypothetical protein
MAQMLGDGTLDARDQTIAVQNTPAVGGQLQRAGKPNLALALEKIVGEHLDIGRARSQTDKRQRNGGHHQLAAPYRRAAGQQSGLEVY